MRLLLFSEGDAETNDAWSGSVRSLVLALRAQGHTVETVDCDLYGPTKALALALTFRWNRRRWWVRYHLGRLGFWLRSRAARRGLERAGGHDAVVQIGATFELESVDPSRLFLYCDSNIRVAQLGAETGHSDAAWLSADEFDDVAGRERGVYGRASRIFSMSRFVATTFTDFFGMAPDRVRAIHAGTNREVADRGPRRGGSEGRILFVGRQFERKGGPMLLEAFRRLRMRHPESRLVIVGPDTNPAPEEPGVEFLGFLNPDVPAEKERLEQAFLDATLYAMPTLFEPLGIAFLEAMAYGLPCVGPDAWAVPEMILDGETGILVADHEPGAWADAMETLLTDRELADTMGRRGRTRRSEYFTWQRVASDLIDEISECLDETGRPRA
jgi:glycosyltransferase involved in cell wall biosynthesis